MNKPTFLIIGAAKAGTTSMFKYLKDHAEVFMAAAKELHYFDAYHANGDEWYLSHFKSSKKALGEASPIYCFYPEAIKKIHDFDPALKLIFLLRNPIDRAISHYWMEFNVHRREKMPMLEAFMKEKERIEGTKGTNNDSIIRIYSYKSRGDYHSQLDAIYKLFPKEQVLILQIEEFEKDPQTSYDRICDFIGVSHDSPEFKKHFSGNYSKDTDPEVLTHLREHFKGPNQALFDKYGIDYR
jgi:Sulfotransferase domain